MAAEQRRVVCYDYAAKDSEELDIVKHETLTVLDSSGLWWKVVNDKGQSGLIPSNYLYPPGKGPAPTPAPSSGRTDLKADEPAHMYHQPDLMMNRANGPSLNITAKAKYRYQGSREDELSLEKGDEVRQTVGGKDAVVQKSGGSPTIMSRKWAWQRWNQRKLCPLNERRNLSAVSLHCTRSTRGTLRS